MSEQKNKFKETLNKIRNHETSEKDRALWKKRLLFLTPFLIAAAIFLLLSLD